MLLRDDIDDLIARSSLGDAGARRVRARTSPEIVAAILGAAAAWALAREVHKTEQCEDIPLPPTTFCIRLTSDTCGCTDEGRITLEKGGETRMPKNAPLRPGTPAPVSGIYQRPDGEQVVSTQGHPLPPGPKGTTYKPVKPAQHKG